MYVYSTLTDAVAYDLYDAEGQTTGKTVTIAGGSNVVSNKTLVTPHGVPTRINDEDLGALERNEIFKLHKANGFITLSKTKEDPEVVASGLEGRDEAAPLVDADFEADGVKPPVVAAEPDEPAPVPKNPRRA